MNGLASDLEEVVEGHYENCRDFYRNASAFESEDGIQPT